MHIHSWSGVAGPGRALVLGLLVLQASCGDSGRAAPSAGMQGRGGRGPEGPVAVAVDTVELGTISRTVVVSGVVEPIRTVGVNSQLSGALLAVNVEEGDAVRPGAVLARLDDRELAAQVASAKAANEVARAAYERAERLRERQVITSAEYDRDRAAYAASQAQLDQLRTRLEHATVRAPIAGVVTEKRVETGDVVAPQSRLFSIADLSTMVVRVQVSELDVVEIAPGDQVEIMLDALPGRSIDGRIRRVFPAADPSTRLVPVEVALQGEDARLARPGFLARVTFHLAARDGVVLVPASAVVRTAGQPAVFVVEDGKALRRSVQAGMTSEGRVEIASGLSAGEVIVVAGTNTLRDGAEVRVVSETPADRPLEGDQD